MVKNIKAISPVVATALLLVVAVVAVVAFQTWFNTYQSGINSKVEQSSASTTAVRIDRAELNTTSTGRANVWVVNPSPSSSITINNITVKQSSTSATCRSNLTSALVIPIAPGNVKYVKTNSLSGCSGTFASGQQVEVVVSTPSGVYSQLMILH